VPIYDYVCGSCGHRFEVFRGINEAGPHQCPECGGPVARAFVPPTIHFKGTGWAKSDRRASSARSRRAETGTPASGSAKSAASGESGESGESGKPSGESGKPSGESGKPAGEPAGGPGGASGATAPADASSSSDGGPSKTSAQSQADR
jgi:putative FmdB family regulatory protein